ncbi:MAG: peroxiredoxin [Pelagibacteraceae bacterium TMED124]|nr:peroxiredoxin [Rickettsiales bacterium]RPG16672.1 MAG: peroxiredoxin [Pelagibacteraceae bacterium TMED124]|tara:strand:- start:3356 stop:3814 length:459 start_codon:yes stop_codon:yes gene_type:complete
MNINDKLNDFNFKIDENKIINTKDLKGQNLIIYFYPKDDTPGCTVEAIEFSKSKNKFTKLNTRILGVSKDSIEKHKKFITKHSLTIDLISDDISICEKFGVWVEKSMYGKKYMGIERATFLFDEDLKLIKVWRNVKVKGHVDEVLNFVKNLN